MANKGNVQLNFNWQILMEEVISHRKSVSFADEDQLRLPSRCSTAPPSESVDVEPFTIEPDMGMIAAGKKQNFTVKFAPLDMFDYEGRLICRYYIRFHYMVRNSLRMQESIQLGFQYLKAVCIHNHLKRGLQR